jgi:ATP-dependent DNA helicase RecQ
LNCCAVPGAGAPRRRVVRAGTLGRWFRRRWHACGGAIAHPFKAALAQFIVDTESAAPGCPRGGRPVDALYELAQGRAPRPPAGPTRPCS